VLCKRDDNDDILVVARSFLFKRERGGREERFHSTSNLQRDMDGVGCKIQKNCTVHVYVYTSGSGYTQNDTGT
jgi:hypothetical protein